MSLQIAREVSKSKIKLTCNLCAKLFEKDIKCIWQIWHVAKFQISLEMVATKKVFAPFKSVLVMQSCPILCDPMDCSPPGPSVHRILQARILEWVVILFSRRSSLPRNRTWVLTHCRQILTLWATSEAQFMLIKWRVIKM